ncbi:hypothetical protein [Sinorhizobium terangae]|uniref:hypothetical protein n=1 Tax=Sinorhizobium terangae TaxID=110322 RepID=UPI00142EDDF4|nr:hypothetical protein [Sinorhizobium terangae]MBB4185898.1 hypothetical protein [Sinorhizobium terangae]WFU49797.1 hypothetical protein QA637_13540 [Sinorhizobium terangae]
MAASNADARKPLRLFMPEDLSFPCPLQSSGMQGVCGFFCANCSKSGQPQGEQAAPFRCTAFRRNSAVSNGLEWVSGEIIVAAAAIALRFF